MKRKDIMLKCFDKANSLIRITNNLIEYIQGIMHNHKS